MLTNGQKKALHSAARSAGIPEDMRRSIQRQIGGFYSAADRTASRNGFVAVMTFYEQRSGGQLPGCTRGYWHQQSAQANPTDALLFRIRQEAATLGMNDQQLDALMAGQHMSGGDCTAVATAPAYWLGRLLEAIKNMIARRERAGGSHG